MFVFADKHLWFLQTKHLQWTQSESSLPTLHKVGGKSIEIIHLGFVFMQLYAFLKFRKVHWHVSVTLFLVIGWGRPIADRNLLFLKIVGGVSRLQNLCTLSKLTAIRVWYYWCLLIYKNSIHRDACNFFFGEKKVKSPSGLAEESFWFNCLWLAIFFLMFCHLFWLWGQTHSFFLSSGAASTKDYENCNGPKTC